MMTRSQFLGSIAALFAAAACSSDGEDGPPDAPAGPNPDAPTTPTPDAPPAACTSTTSSIGTNHGHQLMVSAADLAAGVDKTYDIRGTSAHPHTVVVTAAMFAMLERGQMVTATSTVDAGHDHAVTIRCA